MPKKRRPHKPGHFHRPSMQAPMTATVGAAAPRNNPGDELDEASDAEFDTPDTAMVDAPSSTPDNAVAHDGNAHPVSAVADAEASSSPAIEAAPAATERPTSGDIRGVLIQVAGARLLLPNATIAEVLSYADPDPIDGEVPDWLLGRMRWRGWQLPLIAFGRLAGIAEEKAALGTKVVVLKALAGTSRTPYFAMLTQGFPRLVTVSRAALELEDGDVDLMPRGVQARVHLNENEALLPDLDAIEALVAEALEQAA